MQLKKRKDGKIAQKRGEATEGTIKKTSEWGTSKLEVEAMLLQDLRNKQAAAKAKREIGKQKFQAAKAKGHVAVANIQGKEYLLPQLGGVELAEEFGLTVDDQLNPQRRAANALAQKQKKMRDAKIRQNVEKGKLAEVTGRVQSRNAHTMAIIKAVNNQQQKGIDAAKALAAQKKRREIGLRQLRAEASQQLNARNNRIQSAVAVSNLEAQKTRVGNAQKFKASLDQSKSGIYTVPNRTALVKNPFVGFKHHGYTVPQLGGADFGNTTPLHDCGYLNNVQVLGEDEVW